MKTISFSELGNHFFFAGLLLWFVVQHSSLAPKPKWAGLPMVGHAMQYQPRTPPPMLDPEQLDVSLEEPETTSFWGLPGI